MAHQRVCLPFLKLIVMKIDWLGVEELKIPPD